MMCLFSFLSKVLSGLFSICSCVNRSISLRVFGHAGLIPVMGLEPSSGPLQISQGHGWEYLLPGPCVSLTVGDCAWDGPEPCCRPFQNLQTELCGLPPGVPHRSQEKLEALRVHSQNQDLYAITQPMGGRDSSCVSWQERQVLMTGSKPDGGIAESGTIRNCSWLYNQDHSRRVSHLGASLPSQNSRPWSWTVPGLHSL